MVQDELPERITDRSIVSYPETPPDPGRAGSVIVDPLRHLGI
jgi:hypothetical protein